MQPKVIKNQKAYDAEVNRKKADALKATKKKEADAKAAIKAKAVKAKAAAKEKAKADAKAAADAEKDNKGKGKSKVCLPPFRACTCWSSCLVWAGQGRRRTYRRNGGSLAKQRQPAASGKIGGSGSTSTGGGKGENGGKGKEH